MTSSDRSNSRRKLYAQLAVVLILVVVALLKPRIQPWLDQSFPDLAADGTSVEEATGAKSDALVVPRSIPESDLREPAERTLATVPPVKKQSGGKGESARSESTSASRGTLPKQQSGASRSRESGDEPPPGQLKLIGKNIFRSTAGLVYRPGSRDGHRLKHILKHAKDDLQKPVHGVFEGDRDTILRWIDVAWIRVGKGGKLVRERRQNDRTAWTVNMQEKIGYTGGQKGQSKRKPDCRYLRLVIEDDGETVVTAYPVSSF